jgi:transcriptional regulator with XRE-family HTH domain
VKLRKTTAGQAQVLEAVRNLRLALPATQQQFAERLGVGIATVVRWEGKQPPAGQALAKLQQLAAEYALDGIAAVFHRALSDELGVAPPLPTPGALSIKNDTERDLVLALLEVLRQEQYTQQAEAAKRILDPIVAQRQQEAAYQEARESVRNAIVRFLNKSYPVEEAKRAFSTSAENVAEAVFQNGDMKLIEARTVEIVGMLLREHWSIRDIAERFQMDPEEAQGYAIDAGFGKAVMEYEEEQQDEDRKKH